MQNLEDWPNLYFDRIEIEVNSSKNTLVIVRGGSRVWKGGGGTFLKNS